MPKQALPGHFFIIFLFVSFSCFLKRMFGRIHSFRADGRGSIRIGNGRQWGQTDYNSSRETISMQ